MSEKSKELNKFKEEALSAEGEMYSGKNNDAAMRKGEVAKAKLSQAKRVPSDFPYGWVNEIRDMMRNETGDMKLNPTMSEIVAWWEPRKDKININPSQQKFKDTKDYSIQGGVNRITENR